MGTQKKAQKRNTYSKENFNPFKVAQWFLKKLKKNSKTVITTILFLLILSITVAAQEYHYLSNTNVIIQNHKAKQKGIGINYNVSSELFGGMFHYPEIEFYYNFSTKFSTYGSFNFNKLPSYESSLFGGGAPLNNNNYGYTVAGVYLGKTSFWFLTNYEIALGISHQNMNIDIINKEPISNYEIKKITEKYNEFFLQFNFLKITDINRYIISLKFSKVNFYKVINLTENNIINNFLNNSTNLVKKPLLTSIAYSFYRPVFSKNIFFKYTFGFSFAEEYGAFFNHKIGLIYEF